MYCFSEHWLNILETRLVFIIIIIIIYYLFFQLSFIYLISKAVTLFENDERFKAVERARDKEDLFESYIVELERKVIVYHL